jgi:hypothetical protein
MIESGEWLHPVLVVRVGNWEERIVEDAYGRTSDLTGA